MSTMRIASTEQLLSSIPALLGFTPAQSHVVIALHTHADGRTRIGVTLRADLPAPEDRADCVAQLVAALRRNDVDTVITCMVDNTGTIDELPSQDLVALMREQAAAAGITVTDNLWVPTLAHGQPFGCYDDPQHRGLLPDPSASELTAAAVLAGVSIRESREQVDAELAPNGTVDFDHRRDQMLTRAQQTSPNGHADRRRDYGRLRAALDDAERGVLPQREEGILELLVALCDPVVRDACLAVTGPGALRLWTMLTREAPTPDRAEPAVLLAATAFRAGDGARANVAVHRALDANREHTLAALLNEALRIGVSPAQFATIATQAAAEAQQHCQDTASDAPDTSPSSPS